MVSDGGTGIGRATASALAATGLDVVIVGRRRAVLAQTADALNASLPADAGTVFGRTVDAGDPASVASLMTDLRSSHPIVDVLVCNAGAPARRVTPEEGLLALAASWLEAYTANTLSAVLLAAAVEPLLRSPGGRVVLVGSRAAVTGASTPAYVAAKAAPRRLGALACRPVGTTRDHGKCRLARLHGRHRAHHRPDATRAARPAAHRHRRRKAG